jgi:hypothetical protein
MPIDVHPARMRGRTPEQIIADQKEQAAKDKARANAQKAAATDWPVPVKTGDTGFAFVAPMPADTRTEIQKYVDEIAPANIVGRMVKFSKDGKFVTADDDEPIDEAALATLRPRFPLLAGGWHWAPIRKVTDAT